MGKAKKTKKPGQFQWNGDINRIQSLDNGKVIRVRNEIGKERSFPRDSAELISYCLLADMAMDGLIRRQLTELGFHDILESMDKFGPETETESE